MAEIGGVAAVIVNYRTPQLTAAAAASASREGCAQVIVVNNSPGDGTDELLAAHQGVRVVANSKNQGFGIAANRGARLASRDVLLFVNSDAQLQPGSVAALVAALGDERAIVGPRLVDASGAIQNSAGLLPAPADLALRSLGLHQLAAVASRIPAVGGLIGQSSLAREYASARTATGPIRTTMVSGACFAIGRKAFEELGGFDERFFLYFEDADLCRRALRAGMAIRYVPDAVVSHVGGGSSAEDYHFGPRHARSMRQYLGKWYGPPGVAVAVVLMFLRAVGLSLVSPRRAGRAWRALAATLGIGGDA